MKISAIVAISENNVIGLNNSLPWYLPADLQYFKKKTLNHPVIMGRKSFQSIGRPLPKRTNIVITQNPFFIATGTVIAHSMEEALYLAEKTETSEVFIIGGAEIFKLALPFCQRLYLTRVHTDCAGDVFFPDWEEQDWTLISKEEHAADDKNEFGYTFLVYERI